MRQPVKLIIKKGRLRADGTTLISVQYCLSQNQRLVIGTHIAIPPKYWNKKTRRISKELPEHYGNVERLEKILTEKLRKAEDMVSHAKQKHICPLNFLKINFPGAEPAIGW